MISKLSKYKVALFSVVLGCFFANTAWANDLIQPGEWKIQYDSHFENKFQNVKLPPVTTSECIKPGENSFAQIMSKSVERGGMQCQNLQATKNGNAVTFSLKCSRGDTEITNQGTINILPGSFTGKLSSNIVAEGNVNFTSTVQADFSGKMISNHCA